MGVAAIAVTGCFAPEPREDPGIRLTLDPVEDAVRFEVPTALLMGLPGDHVPLTLQARASTRAIAARELAAAGYCPNGFTGPEGVSFPSGDRSRAVFVVRCL